MTDLQDAPCRPTLVCTFFLELGEPNPIPHGTVVCTCADREWSSLISASASALAPRHHLTGRRRVFYYAVPLLHYRGRATQYGTTSLRM
jgi:hypothetical protein